MNRPGPLPATLLVAAATFLGGCPSDSSRGGPQTQASAANGAYVHSGSGIVLPQRIGAFERGTIEHYDAQGLDIGVGYNLVGSSHHVAATVYVYPGPTMVSIDSPPDVIAEARAHLTDGELERRKAEIRQHHGGALPIEQCDAVRSQGGQSYPGKMAVYEYEQVFGGARMPVRSYLYVFCFVDGTWAVQYRFNYPKSEGDDPDVQAFMNNWLWHGQRP